MKKNILLLGLLYFSGIFSVQANGVTLQKVALSDTNKTAKTAMVRFNIAWENSWRDSINWDAVWIFVKFRELKDSVWKYRHLTVSQTGNLTGTGNATMKFAVPADNKGVFYYRQTLGSGHIKMDSVKLLWNYGLDKISNIDSVEIKVFATEMVYIPTGNFSLGDGNGIQRSYTAFQLKNAPNNYVVITDKWSPLINTRNESNNGAQTDDAILYTDGIRISGTGGLDISGDKVAEYPDFPTGYRSFYCMKYDVTQGQYADFLNTLSLRDSSTGYFYVDTTKLKKIPFKYKLALQNLDPFFGSSPIDLQRHTILLDSAEVKYNVSRPDRAYSKGNNTTYLSFSDWAALRPFTELEYEKAVRGPLPPVYKSNINNYNNNINADTTSNWSGFDWAWGNDTTYARSNTDRIGNSILTYNGVENGTETFNNFSVYKRYINPVYSNSTYPSKTFSGGDGGDGPFRVGIFATDSSTRITSGATYYGLMDFSKNVSQMVLSIGHPANRALSYKIHGDGILNTYGYSDSGEFISNAGNGPGMGGTMYLYKSGAVSERQYNVQYYNYQFNGFRSVRTAPSDN